MEADLRLLRYFVAVAQELHFGRAAQRLFISQPSLSQQIRKFEADIGVALFVRDRRAVALTDAGRELLGPAMAAVEAGEVVSMITRRLRRAQRRQLVVGFHTRWPDNFLPRVLRHFRAARPEVDVELRQYDFSDTSAGLRAADTDVALVHPPLAGNDVRWYPLFSERRVVMLPEDHPLAGRSEVRIAELLDDATAWAVPLDNDPLWRDFWSAARERTEPGWSEVPTVGPLTQEAYFELVASGRAIGLTYAAIDSVYRPPGIRFVPVSDIAVAIRAVAVRADDHRADVAAFVAAARVIAQQDGPIWGSAS
ncbi:LysR substrate-binding domain-containing protein [Agromyces sp. NPDC049794]|uniref:LysR family transcriptional regulator n=1 Tax=Agromyces sp. NPDC049794 TaxID=3154362 RepID=UPI0033C326DC